MRDRGFRVRVLDEDEPLFIAAELEEDGAHLMATCELLPDADGCELELRVTGEAPRTGFSALTGDPRRAVASLERQLVALLKRELGRRALTDEEPDTLARARAAFESTRASAAHRREKRAEIESAFAAGLIDEAERDRLLARLSVG
jgi:hypothetical protein